jgi:ABC-2 type transport system permease protein
MNRLIYKEQLFQLTAALFKETIREPSVLFWGIIFPMLMALGLGLAFTQKTDITHQVAVVEDSQELGRTSIIRTFLDNYAEEIEPTDNSMARYRIVIPNDKLGSTTFEFIPSNWQEAMVLLKRGKLGVFIDETDDGIKYHFDPLNRDAQLTYRKLSKILDVDKGLVPESNDNIAALTVSGTRYIDFLVPGLIAMGLMMSCMWGMSYGIIEKRSQKLLRRMVATPMKKSHFLIAQMIVRIGMTLAEAILLFIFVYLVFGITIQGNIIALLTIFLAGNLAFAGIAIFISSRTAKTETGNGLINVVVMPMMILSGIFFSYQNFPDWIIIFIKNLPLTLLADGMRSIFIEGAGFAEVIAPTSILFAIGIFFFLIGLKIFRWH